ncbi:uncharacterized protein LOC120072120 [Benincasa hispida]|uniref:uncharacterized protein LOC120072120 n=1 Tax=Benincasa hispida TaxID=102211 RepID=UPI0018FFE9C6|nr:uncharacterized protein LOC120072120 [Benincasa hispida]
MSLYALVFGKAFHLPLKLEHKTYWANKKLNFNLDATGEAYENVKIYKERMKYWHDQRIRKLKSHRPEPFVIKEIFPNGVVELTNEDGLNTFKVNGQRIKSYYEGDFDPKKVYIDLGKP